MYPIVTQGKNPIKYEATVPMVKLGTIARSNAHMITGATIPTSFLTNTFTKSFSSAPLLFTAFAAAEFKTFNIKPLAFVFVFSKIPRATVTLFPLIKSIINLVLRGAILMYNH